MNGTRNAKVFAALCLAIFLLAGCRKSEYPETAQTVPAKLEQMQAATAPTVEATEVIPESTEPEIEAYAPSNRTEYDRDFILGCESMGWEFIDWSFQLSGRDASSDGITLSHISFGVPGLVRLTVEDTRYLEVWDGTAWQAFSQTNGESAVIFEGTPENETEVLTEMKWDTPLTPGYYRVGAYYTAALDSGESFRQMCYAKFRIVDENAEKLVKQCQDALQALLDADAYHFTQTNYMVQQRNQEFSHYYVTDVFKSGNDYYCEYHYYFNTSGEEYGAMAELYKNGRGSSWDNADGSERAWKPADYLTADSPTRLVHFLDCAPDTIARIYADGNRITMILPYPSQTFHRELVYSFDDANTLKEISLNYVFTNGDTEADIVLVVNPTAPGKIREMIHAQ